MENNEIRIGSPIGPVLDGIVYTKTTKYTNCNVEIWEDEYGHVSTGWKRTENTEEIESD